jgi:hypothetical protein
MIRPLILLLLAPVLAFAANCDGAVGDWKWFNGGTVTLTQQKTVLMNGKPEGKWTCSDPNKNTVVLRWNGGFVDNLTVAANRMSGKNQQGVTVSADRKTAVARK